MEYTRKENITVSRKVHVFLSDYSESVVDLMNNTDSFFDLHEKLKTS